LLNKTWQFYLSKKMEKEKNQAIEVEKAFKTIKAATGLNDINDMCEKLLTREHNYFTLISAVNEAERKLEILKISYDKSREALQKMQFEDGDNRVIYSEIDKYDSKLMEMVKQDATIKEKLQINTKMFDQLLNWCNKIIKLLKINKEKSGEENNSSSLNEMFESIFYKLQAMIGAMLENKEESFRVIEMYQSKKTSDIIREISKDDALGKEKKSIVEVEDEEETDEKIANEGKEDAKTRIKKNK
jgi:hypothetical protein